MKMLKRVMVVFFLGFVTYLLGGFIFFDLSKPAHAESEDNFRGREVAFGPRPRSWVCSPSWEGVAFSGSEWPLVVYRPVCWIWRKINGFETPAPWR
jgi:hypothetical protein